MKLEEHPEGITPWLDAVGLVERWLGRSERSDELLERAQVGFGGVERARVQHLVLGVLRHHGRIAHLLQRHMKHPPRDRVLAVLQLGGFELVEAYASEDPVGNVAKVVHHAVERSKSLMSKAEQKLVNAVLRRLAEELQVQKAPPLLAQAHVLADYFSHPEWMVKRWLALFGAKATRSLLEWNQRRCSLLAGRHPAHSLAAFFPSRLRTLAGTRTFGREG